MPQLCSDNCFVIDNKILPMQERAHNATTLETLKKVKDSF